MPIDHHTVIRELQRRGGLLSAALLESLVGQFLHSEEFRTERSGPPHLPGMAELAHGLDGRRANPPGGVPFNLIPSAPGTGACCPLCVGVAVNGFRTPSSARRPNFNQLSLLLAEHWLHCRGATAETLVLTPDWNQQAFESRYEGLHTAAGPVFIVECARTGLILRFPY